MSARSGAPPLAPAALRRALQDPAAYGALTGEVGFLETHVSELYFVGERVYKVKKPVDLGFLDFTTLARRRETCEEEVRLNRRLSPDVYLGVVPIVRASGGVRVGGEGEAIEYAVEMVRLPAEHMLERELEAGRIDNGRIEELVRLLVGFHQSAPTGPGVDEHGSRAAVARNVEENFSQTGRFVGELLSVKLHAFLAERATRFLSEHAALFDRRVTQGRVRDGHGDLHASNVCFTPQGIRIFDCLEFAARFRCADVACDLAFLAMDLDHRGYPGFAGFLVRRYAELADDPELVQLVEFYKAYRAVVRAKVGCMRYAQCTVDSERASCAAEVLEYFALAASYCLPPGLVLLCGLPASGKSWVAARVARAMRARLFSSDVRRKLRAGLSPTARVQPGLDAGLYAPEEKRKTYRSLLDTALESVAHGRTAVVDATFSTSEQRAEFVDAAARLRYPLLLVQVEVPEAIALERLAARAADPRATSDADVEVYRAAQREFEPPDELPPEEHIRVDGLGRGREAPLARVIDAWISLSRRPG